jgi:hypothetical protein
MALTLGHYDPAHPDVLSLNNVTLGDINITDSSTPVPTGAYATLNLSGHTTLLGTISSSALFEGLQINLAKGATFTNHGVITTAGPEFGGGVNFAGKGQLVNDGVIDPTHGQAAKVGVDVSGTGVWEIANGGEGFANQRPSSLEFTGSVGANQGVYFSGTATQVTPETLQLDRPGQSHADIDNFGANDTIKLGTTVNAGILLHMPFGDELKLFSGKHEVADLKFGQDAHFMRQASSNSPTPAARRLFNSIRRPARISSGLSAVRSITSEVTEAGLGGGRAPQSRPSCALREELIGT